MPGKIKQFPEYKENFVAYHKILWQAIIDEIKKSGVEDDRTEIKRQVYYDMFEFNVEHQCFGCEYSKLRYGYWECSFCFFKGQQNTANMNSNCLDGNWAKYQDATTKKEAIKYARLIKNFPVRK